VAPEHSLKECTSARDLKVLAQERAVTRNGSAKFAPAGYIPLNLMAGAQLME
jgi:hypothetical protein